MAADKLFSQTTHVHVQYIQSFKFVACGFSCRAFKQEEERQKYTDLEKALQLSEKRIKEQFIGKLQRLEEEKVTFTVHVYMYDM